MDPHIHKRLLDCVTKMVRPEFSPFTNIDIIPLNGRKLLFINVLAFDGGITPDAIKDCLEIGYAIIARARELGNLSQHADAVILTFNERSGQEDIRIMRLSYELDTLHGIARISDVYFKADHVDLAFKKDEHFEKRLEELNQA